MEENEITSPNSVTGEEGVTPAEGKGTVSDSIDLKKLSEAFGTEFKTIEDALKSIKETKNFVGKRKEDIISEAKEKILAEIKDRGIDTSNFVTKDELQKREFYASNPNLKGLETIIEAVKKDTGKTREEVLELEQFKPLLKADKSDANEKSVIHSNGAVNRVTDTNDALKKAMQTRSTDDWAAVLRGITQPKD